MKILATILSSLLVTAAQAAPPQAALKYRGTLTRESQFIYGLSAPVPMFAAQIEQESGWRPGITSWDNGRGLAQFMDSTATTIVRRYPELGKPDPYNPVWAIRAMVRYDQWLWNQVDGDTDCDRWAAALKGYNAGVGYVKQAQQKSDQPGVWFGVTEHIATRQSPKNFEYSRMYPRWILIKRQPTYLGWGQFTCEGFSDD